MKNDIRKQIREKIAALLTAAFGLVAALAWNGASGPFSPKSSETLTLLQPC